MTFQEEVDLWPPSRRPDHNWDPAYAMYEGTRLRKCLCCNYIQYEVVIPVDREESYSAWMPFRLGSRDKPCS